MFCCCDCFRCCLIDCCWIEDCFVVVIVSVVGLFVVRLIVVGLRIVLLEIGNMLHLWERVVQPSNNFSEDCNFKQFVFSFQRSIEL